MREGKKRNGGNKPEQNTPRPDTHPAPQDSTDRPYIVNAPIREAVRRARVKTDQEKRADEVLSMRQELGSCQEKVEYLQAKTELLREMLQIVSIEIYDQCHSEGDPNDQENMSGLAPLYRRVKNLLEKTGGTNE